MHHENHNIPLPFNEYNSGPLPVNDIFKYKMFKKLKYKDLIFYVWQCRNADCYCYIKGEKIIQIHNILVRSDDTFFFMENNFCLIIHIMYIPIIQSLQIYFV